jgi:excisionase family DNA binding protein
VTAGDILTADQVGALLGLGRRQVYEAAGRGEIPCRRVGRRLLFYRPALEQWLAGGTVPAVQGRGSSR